MKQVAPMVDKIFAEFDKDNSGSLDRSEAELSIKTQMKQQNKEVTPEAIKQ